MKFIRRLISLVLLTAVLTGAVIAVYRIFPLRYVSEIRTFSYEMDVDRYLVAALIKAESNFNPSAVSHANAKGLMQLTDETAMFCAEKMAIELNDTDIYNARENIRLGVYYLKRMIDIFGDEDLAVAAYNAGEGRVAEWLKDRDLSKDGKTLDSIPYEETKNHVEKIKMYKKVYKLLYPNL